MAWALTISLVHAGKPSAKSKPAGKVAPRKQTHSRKRKLDDTNLRAAEMQLQAKDTIAQPVSQLVAAPFAAAAPLPFTERPSVHSDSPCNQVPELGVSSTVPISSHSAQASTMQLPVLVPQADISTSGSGQGAGLVTAKLPESNSSAKQLPEPLAQPGTKLPTAAAPYPEVAQAQTTVQVPKSLGSEAGLEQQASLSEVTGSLAAEAVSEGLKSHSIAAQFDAQPSSDMRNYAEPAGDVGPGCSVQMASKASQLPFEAPQQTATAQVPQLTQQLIPQLPSAVSPPLSSAFKEAGASARQQASAANCMTPAAMQWPDGSGSAFVALNNSPTQDGTAFNAGAQEAQTELNNSQDSTQLLSQNVSSQADMLTKPSVMPEALLESSVQQPFEQSIVTLSPPCVHPTAAAVEAASASCPAWTARQAGGGAVGTASIAMPQDSFATVVHAGEQDRQLAEKDRQLAENLVQPFCMSSGVQACDLNQMPHHAELCSNSASRTSNKEGTVTMLEGDGLLGLGHYQGSESDSDS